jgi:CDP-archaeol synthase
MHVNIILKLVLLLVIANGVPVISSVLMRQRFSQPIDANKCFLDGRPILGPAKTIRGVISATLLTAMMAPLFDLSSAQGSLFALLSMCGDLFSSFIKRRLGIASSRSAPLLDQLPETVLPLWLMHPVLGETLREGCAALFLFVAIDWLISRLREEISNDAGDAG